MAVDNAHPSTAKHCRIRMNKKYYITAAPWNTNAEPQLGSLHGLIAADAIARAKRMLGYDVRFRAGAGDHCLSISCDRVLEAGVPLEEAVTEFWKVLRASGAIYDGRQEGWYCAAEEAFRTEAQPGAGGRTCPACGGALVWRVQDCCFFRLSGYEEALRRFAQKTSENFVPAFRAADISDLIPKSGLQDIAVSSGREGPGMPAPDAPGQIVHDWFSGLVSYLSGAGYATGEGVFSAWWPADVHVTGKPSLRSDTILLTAMCMAAGIDPPRRFYVYGSITTRPDGGKIELVETITYSVRREFGGMGKDDLVVDVFENGRPIGSVASKSDAKDFIVSAIMQKFGPRVLDFGNMPKNKGNTADLTRLLGMFGGNPDPFRYYLLRETGFGQDDVFCEDEMIARYEADLREMLGALLARTLSEVEAHQEGMIRGPEQYSQEDEEVRATIMGLFEPAEGSDAGGRTVYEKLVDEGAFNYLLQRIWAGLSRLNTYFAEYQAQALAKDAPIGQTRTFLYVLCEGLRISAGMIWPFMPGTARRAWRQLGIEADIEAASLEELSRWGALGNVRTARARELFPELA